MFLIVISVDNSRFPNGPEVLRSQEFLGFLRSLETRGSWVPIFYHAVKNISYFNIYKNNVLYQFRFIHGTIIRVGIICNKVLSKNSVEFGTPLK